MRISSFGAGLLTAASESIKETDKEARAIALIRAEKHAQEVIESSKKEKEITKELQRRKVGVQSVRGKEFLDPTQVSAIIEDDMMYDAFMKMVTSGKATNAQLREFFKPSDDMPGVQDIDQRITTVARARATENLKPFVEPQLKNWLGFTSREPGKVTELAAAQTGKTAEEFKQTTATPMPDVIEGTVDYGKATEAVSTLAQIEDSARTELLSLKQDIKNPKIPKEELKTNNERIQALETKLADINSMENAGSFQLGFNEALKGIKNGMDIIASSTEGPAKFLTADPQNPGAYKLTKTLSLEDRTILANQFKEAIAPFVTFANQQGPQPELQAAIKSFDALLNPAQSFPSSLIPIIKPKDSNIPYSGRLKPKQ